METKTNINNDINVNNNDINNNDCGEVLIMTRPAVDENSIQPGVTLNGYTFFTTFWDDFSIAEMFGIDAITDTAKRALNAWKDDIKYITELAIVLNYKSWAFYDANNKELSKVYSELYYMVDNFAYNHFNDEELSYYFNITD